MNEKPREPKKSAFSIEPVDVKVALDLDMAIALGDFILEENQKRFQGQYPLNPAIVAFGFDLLKKCKISLKDKQ